MGIDNFLLSSTNARVTRQAEHTTREALRRFLHG
jgi:hypothetical protein